MRYSKNYLFVIETCSLTIITQLMYRMTPHIKFSAVLCNMQFVYFICVCVFATFSASQLIASDFEILLHHTHFIRRSNVLVGQWTAPKVKYGRWYWSDVAKNDMLTEQKMMFKNRFTRCTMVALINMNIVSFYTFCLFFRLVMFDSFSASKQ